MGNGEDAVQAMWRLVAGSPLTLSGWPGVPHVPSVQGGPLERGAAGVREKRKITVGGYVEHVDDVFHGYGRMRCERSAWVKQANPDGTSETVLLYYCRWNAGTRRKPDWQTDPFRSHELKVSAVDGASVLA